MREFEALVRVILIHEFYLAFQKSKWLFFLGAYVEDEGGISNSSGGPCFFHHLSILHLFSFNLYSSCSYAL